MHIFKLASSTDRNILRERVNNCVLKGFRRDRQKIEIFFGAAPKKRVPQDNCIKKEGKAE
jgi:hypothetical protein